MNIYRFKNPNGLIKSSKAKNGVPVSVQTLEVHGFLPSNVRLFKVVWLFPVKWQFPSGDFMWLIALKKTYDFFLMCFYVCVCVCVCVLRPHIYISFKSFSQSLESPRSNKQLSQLVTIC